jgi:Uma2 family endonuclease
MTDERLWKTLMDADEIGIRLEIVNGVPMWEVSPALKHQEEVDRIRASIGSTTHGCACLHYADIYVRFPEGSIKRPDVSLFCERPTEEDEAVTLVPEAVIEIVSKGYEAKDLEFGLQFYLAQGVKDVVVFDPRTLVVLHARRDGTKRLVSPVPIALECGCGVTV